MIEAREIGPVPETAKVRQGVLLILAGPTAVGKNSVMDEVLKRYPDMQRIISTTTRPPRAGEQEGVDYHFTDVEDFNRREASGEFLETVTYGGCRYGARKSDVEPILHKKRKVWIVTIPMSLEIGDYYEQAFEASIARELKERTLTVFVGIESLMQLRGRSRGRNDNPETFKRRIREDWQLWKVYGKRFEHIVKNRTGELGETVEQVVSLLEQRQTDLQNSQGFSRV